jgi:hypothetical protein
MVPALIWVHCSTNSSNVDGEVASFWQRYGMSCKVSMSVGGCPSNSKMKPQFKEENMITKPFA